MCGWFLLPICAISSLRPYNITKSLSDEIQKAATQEFVLDNSWNILRNSLNKDKNITLFNHPLPHYTAATAFDTSSWQLTQSVLNEHKSADKNAARRSVPDENVKIHNDFHYGINKSNQENNFYNNQKQPTPLLSNIKLVNSSTLSPSSASSLSPRATNSTSSSSASSYFERVELLESLTHTKNEKLLLHRNKRYLLFPEGSSFQLVFDLIIAVVDYTNFAIMGITCAVAWELPSKPPSEIIENFRTKLNDGTFGLSRRNDSTLQQLEYINSQRTEQEAVEDNKRWEVGVPVDTANMYNQPYTQYQQHQQLSATVATTSGREKLLTNAPKPQQLPPPPSSSNFYHNNDNNYRHREKFQPSTATTSFYSQHPQQQQWPNYNFETFDTNQRKTLYANDNKQRPMYRNDFAFQANKNNNQQAQHSANKWNAENWQPKKHQYSHQQPQPQQTKIPYNDAGDYWNKDNWWDRNKDRIEKHWQENQQKWSSQYQENSHNYQTPMFSRRTGRNRKILNKPPKHRIYPVFGKRRRRRSSSADHHRAHLHNDDFSQILQDIHTREHLQTRQKLYGKIEKLYKARGQNGTACVLRALCETEKNHLNAHYNETPQSFVMELLRSIFALPKAMLANSKDSSLHLHSRYTDAVLHAHDVTQSCSQQYYDCEYSITYDI
ncbi:uncharacterized protein LOC135949003 [Calliphora vicina]|uniref:uncharacterized protein LOC135949003 n=1 Tax=Calliphora vicina TaxID=7373 RepID=UPI00325AF7BF